MFEISYLERSKKKKEASATAQGALVGPAPKKLRTSKASASSSSHHAISNVSTQKEGAEAPLSSSLRVVPRASPHVGSPPRQSVLSSSDLAWQKLTSSVGEVELAELRGTLSGTMAKNMNHDLFKVLAQSFAFYNRLANTERLLEVERKRREEALIELEKAKDIAAVAEAEKQEILQHELKTIEENKALKTNRARLDREVEREKARVSQLEAEVSRLRGEVENAGSAAITNFKNTDDFQAIPMPVFLEDFEHAKAKFSASFPELDISQIAPGRRG